MSGGAPRDPAKAASQKPESEPQDSSDKIEPVEDRPNVGTTTPDAYPKDGPSGGGKPDYGSPKR